LPKWKRIWLDFPEKGGMIECEGNELEKGEWEMSHMILTPAYGRDYKSAADVKADWEANKDFVIASIGKDMGRYCNKQDAETYGMPEGSYIRYNKLAELTHIGIWEEAEMDEESIEAETKEVEKRRKGE
jgi:hypothetical protein